MSIYGFQEGQKALWYTTSKGPPDGPEPLHVVIIKQETVKGAFPNPFWDEHHYRVRLEDGTEKVVFYRSMFPDYS
jgi:hypothetical protein